MSKREDALSVLNRRIPKRVPWFGDLDYWVASLKKKNELPEQYYGDGYFQLHRDLQVGFHLQGRVPYKVTTDDTVQIIEKEENDVYTQTIITPLGTMQWRKMYSNQTYSWAHLEHCVKDIDDIKKYKYYLEHSLAQPDYEETARRQNVIGDNGVVMAYLPRSPFMDMVTEISGLETLIYLLYDYPEEMDDFLAVMERFSDVCAELALQSPAECLMIPENLSSEMVNEALYYKYMQPYQKKWIEKIRAAGKYSFIHMDGTLKGLVRQVAETGFDVIEAVTTAPGGDMTLEELDALVPKNTILWGGLPGVMFTQSICSEAEFKQYILKTLAIMSKMPRFVLSVADQVPPDGSEKRIRMVNEIIEEYYQALER